MFYLFLKFCLKISKIRNDESICEFLKTLICGNKCWECVSISYKKKTAKEDGIPHTLMS